MCGSVLLLTTRLSEQIGHIVTVTLKTLAYSGGGGRGGDFPRKATNLLYGCLITRSELYIFF